VASTNGYQVDPDEVEDVVRAMFAQIDEFTALCRQFGQLVPPVAAFGLIASPAGLAAATAHELIQRAQQALEVVLSRLTENVQTAMTNYQAADAGGVAGVRAATAALSTPDGRGRA
jgi:hypothetical protein